MGVGFTKDKQGGIFKELGINKPVINIPGCPAHPDWVLLTVGAIILGKIKLPDDLNENVFDQYTRPEVSSRLTMLFMTTALAVDTMTVESSILR